MKKIASILLLLSTTFTLFGCASEFFTTDPNRIARKEEIIVYAICGIIQLLFILGMLSFSGMSTSILSDFDSSIKKHTLSLFISTPILFFAGRFLSTAVNALHISSSMVNEGLEFSEGKNFLYLINDIILRGNSWMRTEYIGGKWIWTFLAGIGLVLLWMILTFKIFSSFNSIIKQDNIENREIEARNAAKTKKYSIETNYEYDYISDKLIAKTHINDVTKYESLRDTPMLIFSIICASLICMPAFTLISVVVGDLIFIIKEMIYTRKEKKK